METSKQYNVKIEHVRRFSRDLNQKLPLLEADINKLFEEKEPMKRWIIKHFMGDSIVSYEEVHRLFKSDYQDELKKDIYEKTGLVFEKDTPGIYLYAGGSSSPVISGANVFVVEIRDSNGELVGLFDTDNDDDMDAQ